MTLKLIFDTDEGPSDVTNLHIAACIFDVCKSLDVDAGLVGHILQAQANFDEAARERQMNMPCRSDRED